jgi:mxaJ protein
MSFRFLNVLLFASTLLSGAEPSVLRVCADPNNLPFSNQAGQGFENRIAELLAAQMGLRLEYTWWAQRKNFVRQSLNGGRCDVIPGVPADLDSVLATHPYYRSSYVFVSRRDRNLHITELSDERLKNLRIGINIVGDDYAPPALVLARRGLTSNIVGFSLFAPYGVQSPAGEIVASVARGDTDLAIVWGPVGGYFASRSAVPLDVSPVAPSSYLGVPFTYSISIGVRKSDIELSRKLDEIIAAQSSVIHDILSRFGVPELPTA